MTVEVDEDRLIDTIGSALRSGGPALREVPELIGRVVAEDAWRDFTTRRGQKVHHERFSDFVTTPPLAGLGSDLDLLRRVVAGTDAEKSVKALLYGEIEKAPEPGEVGRGRVRERTTLPKSETVERHLARLKRDDPALAEQVVNGEMTAYQAARSKGWKPPRIQVTTPERTAVHLRKHLTAEQCAELARLLTSEDN